MKCFELRGPDGVEGLELVDKPTPKPARGQVLVRLNAATLNYRDLLIVRGGYGSRQKFPLIPLSDGAGVVETVGPDVRTFVPGDRVVGSFFETWIGGEPSAAKMHGSLGGAVDGVLAEYRVFPEQALVRDSGSSERRRSRGPPLCRTNCMERRRQTRRRESWPNRADPRHWRPLNLRASVREDVRRARHCDLVKRCETRTPEIHGSRRHDQLQDHARLGKEGTRVEWTRRGPRRRGWRGRHTQ